MVDACVGRRDAGPGRFRRQCLRPDQRPAGARQAVARSPPSCVTRAAQVLVEVAEHKDVVFRKGVAHPLRVVALQAQRLPKGPGRCRLAPRAALPRQHGPKQYPDATAKIHTHGDRAV